MKKFFVTLCLIHILCNGSPSPTFKANHPDSLQPNQSHSNDSEGPRVLFGKQTSHTVHPFLISLLKYAYNYRRWNFQCGGSLISQTAALTAAHCVVAYPSFQGAGCEPVFAGALMVTGGADNIWSRSQFKQSSICTSITVHPKCVYHQQSVISWDTAVLTLKNAFSYNQQIQPLKLFSTDARANLQEYSRLARTRTLCNVIGYGDTGSARVGSDNMLSGDMTLMTNEECQENFCRYDRGMCNMNILSLGMSCTSTQRGTPCKGDSGGPLVCNGFLFGTVSWGKGCFSDASNTAVFGDMAAVTHMVNMFRRGGGAQQRSVKNAANPVGSTNVRLFYSITLLLATFMYHT